MSKKNIAVILGITQVVLFALVLVLTEMPAKTKEEVEVVQVQTLESESQTEEIMEESTVEETTEETESSQEETTPVIEQSNDKLVLKNGEEYELPVEGVYKGKNPFNLRAEPDKTSDCVTRIRHGEKFLVLKIENEEWVYVSYNSYEGYLYYDILDESCEFLRIEQGTTEDYDEYPRG